jgi:anaerobic ribonucleoside-triphosphate reductase
MNKIADFDKQISELKTRINDPKLCDSTADTWTRISGYFRPVSFWNDGKQAEFMQRVEFSDVNI